MRAALYPAKDPVNMAGFMVEDLAGGIVKQFHTEDVKNLPYDGSVTLLDTRTAEEYTGSHIEGFQNIPVDELWERLGKLDKGKPVSRRMNEILCGGIYCIKGMARAGISA